MLLFVALFAGVAFFFIQNQAEKRVRAALEDAARQNDVTLTMKDVRYNLLKNILTIESAEAKFTVEGVPAVYTVEQIDVINPNRPLALAFSQMRLDDVRGFQPVADAVDVRNLTTGPDMPMKVAVQRFEGISANMDVLRDYMAKPEPTMVESVLAVAESLAYKSRTASGMTSSFEQDGLSVVATVGSLLETDYANLALDSLTVTDTVVKIQQAGVNTAFTLKKMKMERLTLARSFFELALSANLESEEDANKLLKALFLGERPFLASLSFDDMLLVTPALNVPIKSLQYENSATSPFAVRLDLKGLTLPTALLFTDAAALLVADMPTITYNASLSSLVPYKDPTALTKIATQGSIDKLGSLDMDVDGLLDFSLTDPDAMAENFRLAKLKMTFTDDGLTPRAARASQSVMGVDLTKLGPLGTELLWAAVPQEQRTKSNRAVIEQLMGFLQKPGSIDVTLALPQPMTSAELEKADFGPEVLQINVTNGQKSLEELVQALPK